MICSPQMLTEIAANIKATAERELQESEGRIPPLTQREAYNAYGKKKVDEWVSAGMVIPIRNGKAIHFKHSELENSLATYRISCKYTDGYINQTTKT